MEVIGLQQLVVELYERESTLKALLHSFEGQHPVDGEIDANITEEPDIVQIDKPVSVIHHPGPADSLSWVLGEIDDLSQLRLYLLHIAVDILHGEDLPHLRLTGWIPDKTGTAANEGDRIMTSLLQVVHREERHYMTDME